MLALSSWEAKHEKKARRSKGRGGDVDDKHWVVASHSSYLVNGITEHLPKWRRNNGKDDEGNEPSNFDLFDALQNTITAEESKQRVSIGFWKIPRIRNTKAATLARAAARSKFTPSELTEISKEVRAKKHKMTRAADPGSSGKLVAGPEGVETKASTSTTKEVESTPLESTSGDTQIQVVGNGRVRPRTDQGTSVLTAAEQGSGRVDGKALSPDLKAVFIADDELLMYPQISWKRLWQTCIIGLAVRLLILEKFTEHAEKWSGAYVYLLLLVSSTEWRDASRIAAHSCVYILGMLLWG